MNLVRTVNYILPKEPFGHPLYTSTLKNPRGRREGSRIFQQLTLYPQPFPTRDPDIGGAVKNHLNFDCSKCPKFRLWLRSKFVRGSRIRIHHQHWSPLISVEPQVPVKFESRQKNLTMRDYHGEQVFLSPLQSQAKMKASAPIIPKYPRGSCILNTKSTISLEG